MLNTSRSVTRDSSPSSNSWGAYILGRDVALSNVHVTADRRALDFNGEDLVVSGGKYALTDEEGDYAVELRASVKRAKLSNVKMSAIESTWSGTSSGLRAGGDEVYVQGCDIRGRVYGAWLQGASTKKMTFVDNVIESVQNNAFYHNVPNVESALVFRGNLVKAPSTHRAILVSSSVVGPIVQGNTVLGGNVGVRITAAADRAIVKDNNLLGATVGAEVLADGSIVADNLVSS